MKSSAKTLELFLQSSKKACQEVKLLIDAPRESDDFTYIKVGAGGDKSLGLDLKAEQVFFRYFTPFASIHSEEFGAYAHEDSAYNIVLDPIDGSDNMMSLFPYFGTCMALEYQGITVAAVVCNLVNGDFIYRIEEGKAFRANLLNDREETMMLNSHAKVGIFEKSSLYTKIVDKLMKKKLKFRSPGAVALSLVYAFDARFMIFLGKKRHFDLQAGLFIVESLPRYEDDHTIIIAHDDVMLQKLKAEVLGDKS